MRNDGNMLTDSDISANRQLELDKKRALACTAGLLQSITMMMLEPEGTQELYRRYESMLGDVSTLVRFINSVEVSNG